MSTITADPEFLIHILDALVVNFLSPEAYNRLEILLNNRREIESDPDLYSRYDREVNSHIEKLSNIFAIRDKAGHYFKELPIHVRVNLKARYEIAKDLLADIKDRDIDVPADLTMLFKWFFLEFWYNSRKYTGFEK